MKANQDKILNSIKTTLFISAFFILISMNVKSQNSFTLPDGYHAFKDYDGKEERVDRDFDGDGVTDLAIVCADKNETKTIVVFLASKWLIDQSFWRFPWDYDAKLSFTNNVLTITGDGQFLSKVLKFKYYTDLNIMKLIGYGQDEYVRNANGMVKTSSETINLNTGEYQANGRAKKKIKIAAITISDIDKYFDYLSKVDGNN